MRRRAAFAFRAALALSGAMWFLGCSRTAPPSAARNIVLITIDTLRPDRVGAYGYGRARTPAIDALAASGARFTRAYAAAPITLPSHATMLTGKYPPGHGARDNGMRMSPAVPTLAAVLKARGFRTAAFVGAFPLDHQFGLAVGFDTYGDHMPRGAGGRLADERPAEQVVAEAIAWVRSIGGAPFFLWVHLFEPHAPYAGDPSRPRSDRYDDEIATADHAIGRLVSALEPVRRQTLVAVAGDHGEAFGEHGEIAHSIFVYDTTLQVPLIVSGPGVGARIIADAVTLADLAPTLAHAAGTAMKDVDGIDLGPALSGSAVPERELYAESFAPLLEFGWAPLRTLRSGSWKYIAAPKPELYDLAQDAGETINVVADRAAEASRYADRVNRYSGDALPKTLAAELDPAAAERLRALGYSAGSPAPANAARPDPKDRRALAARIAQVTSGDLTGASLVGALEAILRDDPANAHAHLRLGVLLTQAGDCARAEPHLGAAIAEGLPSADAYLSLATCRGRRNDLAGADAALSDAARLEPDNPVVTANRGILQAARGDLAGAMALLTRALAADPDFHEARFNLAVVYARAGRRAEAAAAARDLLARLPPGAPQRAEVERLLYSVR